MEKCSAKTEVYSRVVGFFTPVKQWNPGKKEEFGDRRTYVLSEKAAGEILLTSAVANDTKQTQV